MLLAQRAISANNVTLAQLSGGRVVMQSRQCNGEAQYVDPSDVHCRRCIADRLCHSFCLRTARLRTNAALCQPGRAEIARSLYVNETTTIAHLGQVYEGLIGRGKDLKIIPALAESWETSSRRPAGAFLRKNVKFHGRRGFHRR
jgi:ABC-type transport system substrate-binding protein